MLLIHFGGHQSVKTSVYHCSLSNNLLQETNPMQFSNKKLHLISWVIKVVLH